MRIPALRHAASRVTGKFGYGAVGVAVGVESFGVAFPGETTLIAAALYAGDTDRLNIILVVAAAAAGAIIGDNIRFLIGCKVGFPLLIRYGNHIHMSPPRIKLGQYLFLKYGGKVLFFGRFVAILRALAAFLVGANRKTWPRFLVFNAAGGIVWASAYGFGAYLLGKAIHLLIGPIGIVLGGLALLVIIAAGIFIRRPEKRLEAEAEKALPGPIQRHPSHASG
jgi:membrane protein DedA with SNARE-associated domain